MTNYHLTDCSIPSLFDIADLPKLIAFSLQALQASNPDEELTATTCSLGAVGIGLEMTEYTPEEITTYV